MDKIKISRNSFVLALPLVILIASFMMRSASGPFWQYGDPCFNYIFNSFLIIKHHVPMDITHPGTPLQVLIAIFIRLLNPGRSGPQAVDQALIDPDLYLNAVYVFLVLGFFVTSILLALYVYRKTHDRLAAVLTQLPGFIFLVMPSFDNGSFPVLPVVANVNAEPVFMIIMNLFNLLLLGLYFSKDRSRELWKVILLAVVCGLGMATKINFLLILFTALLLVPLRKKILFILAGAASFVFFTLPIISKYPQLFQWVSGILEHSSRYGTGDDKFINWNLFYIYVRVMVQVYWFFIATALGLWIWSSWGIMKDRQDKTPRFIWALAFCFLMQVAACAKHFSFHYLLPSLALFGSMFPIFYLTHKVKYKILKPLAMALVLIFVVTSLVYAVPYYNKLRILSRDIHDFNAKIIANYPSCSIIPTTTGDIDFFVNEQEALQRANGTNFRLESDDLFRLYPGSYYFFSEEVTSPDPSVESYGIWNYKERVYGDEIRNISPCAIFIKYTSDFSQYPYQVRLLDSSKYLSAYLYVDSTEKAANYFFAKSMESFKAGDLKQALELGIQSRQLNYEPRGQLEYFLNLVYQDFLSAQKNSPIPSGQRQ